MCWYGRLLDEKVAKKDITTYKILGRKGDVYFAPYRDFQYKVGKIYSTEIKPNVYNLVIEIYEGVHSLHEDCRVQYSCPTAFFIYNTFGLWIYSICTASNRNVVIAKCTIPQGTRYFENEDGEIVSESIRIDEVYQTPPFLRTMFKKIDKK